MNGKPFSAHVFAIALLTTLCACATRTAPEIANASTAPLIDSQWRLTRLSGQTIVNPPGPQQVFFMLNPRNTAVSGFAGCNRMFGRYALDGEMLKFDAMGGTKMACLDQARMDVEQRFLTMFAGVARWKLTERELELFEADGKSLATFEAPPVN
jgi:heat shock protein HslJ